MPDAEAPLKIAVDRVRGGRFVLRVAAGPAATTSPLYEADTQAGRSFANTVDVEARGGAVAVDTGFIVYNEANYPNLTALLDHLEVATKSTDMSFGVSLDDGALEYGSAHPSAIFAQPSNLLRPRFWSMLKDLVRFYRKAPQVLADLAHHPCTLGELLDRGRLRGGRFRRITCCLRWAPSGPPRPPARAIIPPRR